MIIGVVRSDESDKLVSLTPEFVERWIKAGQRVWVESGAGEGAGWYDPDYEAVGARVVPAGEIETADVLTFPEPPTVPTTFRAAGPGTLLVGMLRPYTLAPAIIQAWSQQKLSTIALDATR